LFFSCAVNDWDDTIITNSSKFEVTFKFSNTGKIVLSGGEEVTFPTKAYQRLESFSPVKRVEFTYSATNDGYTGEFRERTSWEVKVRNAIGEKATLSADGWMDDIEAIEDDDSTGKVYTENPHFTAKTESGFPAVAEYTRDADGTFYVTIH
jgi:hypothetical protein